MLGLFLQGYQVDELVVAEVLLALLQVLLEVLLQLTLDLTLAIFVVDAQLFASGEVGLVGATADEALGYVSEELLVLGINRPRSHSQLSVALSQALDQWW